MPRDIRGDAIAPMGAGGRGPDGGTERPRVLVVALGRINAADTANNGLLLRNLLGDWPRERLAQVFSSGDNGDPGFFGHYYRLQPADRVLGAWFYRLKDASAREPAAGAGRLAPPAGPSLRARLASLARRAFVDTGLYELVFRPSPSREMLEWARAFRPDVVLAQGYNLTFTWLPLALSEATGAPIAFLTTDDWPSYLYAGQHGEPRFLSWLMRPVVRRATRRLLSRVSAPLAFGQPMADEYKARYGLEFVPLHHADDPGRFDAAPPHDYGTPGVATIVAAGAFNPHRWPLLLDANECCRLLAEEGIRARVVVLSVGMDPEGRRALAGAPFVQVLPDPGNDKLPGYLKGADVLLLAEGFDERFVEAIHLSVSSKAHLFMFSRRPVVVYAHAGTGIAKYAASHGWGRLVTRRDPSALRDAIRALLTDPRESRRLIDRGTRTAEAHHLRRGNLAVFLGALEAARRAHR